MSTIYDIARQKALELLDNIGLLKHQSHYSLQLSRYILGIPLALPLQHVILGERPYATDIHPHVSSAMSFDPDATDNTPSVHFLALGISNTHDISYETVYEWFRDSWKYLTHGIVVLNVCSISRFNTNESEYERVAMEVFLREMIHLSRIMGGTKIHIYPMGNPARHSSNRIRSSIKNAGKFVTVHGMANPAQYQHKCSDQWSREFTLDSKAATKLLYNIVSNTYTSDRILTFRHYDIIVRNMTDERDELKTRLSSFADVFDEAEKYFRSPAGKKVEDSNADLFKRIAAESRSLLSALSQKKITLLFQEMSEPPSASKPSYYSKRQDYNKKSYRGGTKSYASSTASTGKKIRMAGDSDEEDAPTPSTPTPAPSTPAPSTPMKTPGSVGNTPSSHSAARSVTSSTSYMGKHNTIPEDSSEDEGDAPPPAKTPTMKSPAIGSTDDTDITPEEATDMSFVADFLGETEEYKIPPTYAEFLTNANVSKKASTDVAMEVLSIIRRARSDPNQRSIQNALGYDGMGIQDMSSEIMQWIQGLVKD